MSNSESMDVELLPDGSWKTMSIKLKKEKEECSPPTKVHTTSTSFIFIITVNSINILVYYEKCSSN